MLVARRDPPLHSAAYDGSRMHGHGHSRFMTALQVIGTLVGIPVGLASVYSIYHSNFTVEARCESLRGNIVSMLDKSADASTLRMLVRRDVVTFETNCAAVDPDAVKAFRALLTAKVAAPAAAPQQAAREPVHQAEPAKQLAAPKQKPAPVAAEAKPVEAKPVQRDAETSDAKWIASVRDALVHAPEAPEAHEAAVASPAVPAEPQAPAAVQPITPPAMQPAPQPRVVHEAPAVPPMSLTAPAAPAAPALPPPVPVAAAPVPPPAADHPVPPASIPDPQPAAKPVAATSGHSWLAKIPLVNRVIGD